MVVYVGGIVLYFATHYLLVDIHCYAIDQLDIYIVIFFVGAAFFFAADKIDKWSVSVLMLISIAAICVCSLLAQHTVSNYWLYSVIAVLMPVVVIIFMMGLSKFNFVGRIESTRIYKWLLKHNMDIYLMQAPAIYRSFKIFYPMIGQNCFLCIVSCFVFTIVIDVVLVLVLTCIRNALMGWSKTIRKTE